VRSRIDIVLPCYNPSSAWKTELENFHRFIQPHHEIQYIVVNDGSPGAGVHEAVGYLSARSIPVQLISYAVNRGKGHALRKGVEAASAEFIIYTDIDFPFTDQSMLDVASALVSRKADIVAGFRSEAYYASRISPFRKHLSRVFRFFVKRALRMPFTDTQCGLKGFNRKGREGFLRTTIDRYLFDFEFIYTAVRDPSLKLQSVPVQLKDNVVFSQMRARILLQESVNLVKVLLRRRRS
jgi:glycosyltransferase involved in cell wall biosynthesis